MFNPWRVSEASCDDYHLMMMGLLYQDDNVILLGVFVNGRSNYSIGYTKIKISPSPLPNYTLPQPNHSRHTYPDRDELIMDPLQNEDSSSSLRKRRKREIAQPKQYKIFQTLKLETRPGSVNYFEQFCRSNYCQQWSLES